MAGVSILYPSPAVVVAHGAIIAALLAAGWVWPRRTDGNPYDSILNVSTGAMLAGTRFLMVAGAARAAGGLHLVPVGWIHGGLAQFCFAFLVADFARYWLHRAHHRFGWLWRFHRVHHSPESLDATTGLRMHVVDFVQLSLLPVLLFGVVFDTHAFDARVWAALVVTTDLFDALQHANVRLEMRHPLVWGWNLALNNPVFHSWHHSTESGQHHGNYGQALTVWDRLFGSHVHRMEPASAFGLPPAERLENSLLGLQMLKKRDFMV